MPDLLAGTTVQALDTPPVPYANDASDISGFTDIVFVSGTPVVGVVFTAPTTGRVRVDWHARFQPASAVAAQVGFALRTGGTLGAGTVVQDGLNENCLESPNVSGAASRVQAGMFFIVSGLTPGSTYNAVVCHRMVAAGTGNLFARSISVSPVS
ncbi:hypothetical protein ACFT7S_28155 [Streptomyces sp. NPDC057136]|uniref:hypothetical protein n=1 Tax=Streptomyces sp. NPDC057136 TaxID=3346029 RepID=UPI0036458755